MSNLVTEEETFLLPHRSRTTPTWGKGSKVFLVVATITAAIVLAVEHCSRQESSIAASNALNEEVSMQDIPMLGSSKKDKSKKSKKDKKKKHDDDDDDDYYRYDNLSDCEDGEYSKRTLKLAYELPFASLFKDTKGVKKHEASSVTIVDDTVYAVCDSSWAISKFSSRLHPFAEGNVQVGDPNRDPDEDSDYEALFYDDGTFYAIRESILHGDKKYHAIIEEIVMYSFYYNDTDDQVGMETDYSVVETCSCELEFEGDSKGFEGAVPIRDLNNELVILALCEGNHCSEGKKDDTGHGVFVAMRKEIITNPDGSTECVWMTVREISIPRSADFADYSAATMNSEGRMAIVSQENSQVWIGQLNGMREDGLWDVDAIQFSKDDDEDVYDFPKNNQCMTVYCNVEGIYWLNDEMLIAVSDKMKKKQDFRCFEKDQSVHVFMLP